MEWDGRLDKVEEYGSGLVLDGPTGTKAVINLWESELCLSGGCTVRAIVQVFSADAQELGKMVGQPLPFGGRLLKADGLMHNLFVGEGVLCNVLPAQSASSAE